MMKFNLIKKEGAGVLFHDKEITCIKNKDNLLEVHKNSNSFKEMISVPLSARINQIGKYSEGIYYFEDQSTHFLSFDSGRKTVVDAKFYYNISPSYKAYTSMEKKDVMIFESENSVEVPIIQRGGQKLFFESGVVQIENKKDKFIVFHEVLERGRQIWLHSFSELIQSKKAFLHSKILNHNDKLFFVVDGDENRGLFCLELGTGQILHKFDNLWYELFSDNNLIFTTRFENTLCKINTETLEVEEWKVNDLIAENGFDSIHDHRCVAQDNKFYFTQSIGDNKAKLGVLDTEKKELVYKYEFKPENGAIGSIQVSDIRIFVHTQDNTLHIFEKE